MGKHVYIGNLPKADRKNDGLYARKISNIAITFLDTNTEILKMDEFNKKNIVFGKDKNQQDLVMTFYDKGQNEKPLYPAILIYLENFALTAHIVYAPVVIPSISTKIQGKNNALIFINDKLAPDGEKSPALVNFENATRESSVKPVDVTGLYLTPRIIVPNQTIETIEPSPARQKISPLSKIRSYFL